MKNYTENEISLINRINKNEFNITTLEGEIKTASMVTIECNNKHLIKTNLGNLIKTGRCMRCEKVHKYYEILEMFNDYGFTMISTEDDYQNTRTDLEYKCDKGHTQFHNYGYFSRGHKCTHCFKYGSFYSTVEQLLNEGYVVHTNVTDIKTSKDKIHYTCPRGHNHSTSVNSMQQGVRCYKCKVYKIAEANKTPLGTVIKMFENNDYKIIANPKVYENGNSIFSVECPNAHIYDTTVANFKSGYRCKRCAYDNNSGEGNHGWKGGITPLHNRIRCKIAPWKLDSMKFGNYKCFISGSKKDMIVHHVVNFSNILLETLSDLDYDVKEKVNEYTDYELEQIENLCLQKHYDYGLGIIMTEDLHIIFHKIYGKLNNTMEQVLEFKKDYLNGKYNT